MLCGDAGLYVRKRPMSKAAAAARRKRQDLDDELERAAQIKAPRPSVPGGVAIRGGRLTGGRPIDPALWGSGCDAAAWPELWADCKPGEPWWNQGPWAQVAAAPGDERAAPRPACRPGPTLKRWAAAKKLRAAASEACVRSRDPSGAEAEVPAKRGRWRRKVNLDGSVETWTCKSCRAASRQKGK